jgi:hypothetical protein
MPVERAEHVEAFVATQPAVLIGLIAHLVGTPQQNDIARMTFSPMSEGPAAAPP